MVLQDISWILQLPITVCIIAALQQLGEIIQP